MSNVGREIVEAADAEAAKRFSDDPRFHWWRRSDEYLHVNMAITHDKRFVTNGTFAAAACGRLIEYQRTTRNGEDIDCRECAEVYFIVNPPDCVRPGV